MKIASILENQKIEKRIAITPEIAKKYISLGFEVLLSENYGSHIGIKDEEYKELGVLIFKDEINYSLGNIIQNAIIYTKSKVDVFLDSNDQEIILKIKDNGNGFSRDVLDKLVEPYISKNKKGMGLGLFIAKNLTSKLS